MKQLQDDEEDFGLVILRTHKNSISYTRKNAASVEK